MFKICRSFFLTLYVCFRFDNLRSKGYGPKSTCRTTHHWKKAEKKYAQMNLVPSYAECFPCLSFKFVLVKVQIPVVKEAKLLDWGLMTFMQTG